MCLRWFCRSSLHSRSQLGGELGGVRSAVAVSISMIERINHRVTEGFRFFPRFPGFRNPGNQRISGRELKKGSRAKQNEELTKRSMKMFKHTLLIALQTSVALAAKTYGGELFFVFGILVLYRCCATTFFRQTI